MPGNWLFISLKKNPKSKFISVKLNKILYDKNSLYMPFIAFNTDN